MRIMNKFTCVIFSVPVSMAMSSASAQEVTTTATGTTPISGVQCGEDGCVSDEGTLVQIRTRGEQQPLTDGSDRTSSGLQPDRRVSVSLEQPARPEQPGRANLSGKWAVQLANGGVIWATEDPSLGQPILNVNAPTLAGFDHGKIVKPVRFVTYSNYPDFIKKAEIQIFRSTDVDLVSPIAKLDANLAAMDEVSWDGALPTGLKLKPGDELIYIMRVWDEKNVFDETFPRRIQLVSPEEADRGAQLSRQATEKQQGLSLSADEAERRSLTQGVFGADGLRQQNIAIYGSRIRIQGRNIPERHSIEINGQNHPVDQEGKMVAEYLVPIGNHKFDVSVFGDKERMNRVLDVDVTGRYMFLVGIADITASAGDVSGSVEPLAPDDSFRKDFLVDGRLAFYLKGKVKGKYLITAQMDTTERQLSDVFDGFWKADPTDVFRRLDPDAYYPVYGDDSTSYRDIDTMGRLYVRVDWDKNTALFGNFETGITGTEYAQYSRALYGGALKLRSRRTTEYGDPGTELRGFASESQTSPGHSEFLGTGGSLYYLKHTDLLPGSDRVVIEVRDPSTGRVENRIDLLRGADYEMDELQGRMILTKPLAQLVRDNTTSITSLAPLDGFAQYLLVDYEYVPSGLDMDNASFGARGKHWFGDHIGIGGTWVEENRAGDDYSLKGVDLTLQAGRGTYLKVERSWTKATSAPVFYSDNGGLDFREMNAVTGRRKGDATAIEARVNLKELGLTTRDWSASAWWRDVDAGYSVARADLGRAITEYGGELQGEPAADVKFYARASKAEQGAQSLTQGQFTAEWSLTPNNVLTGEVRHVQEDRLGGSAHGTLGAVQYTHRIGSSLDLYAIGQLTLDDDQGAYADNDALTVGGKYLFGKKSTIGAEVLTGDRGDAARVNAEYKLAPDHSIYGSYTYSTDRTDYDPLFNNRGATGATLGQRWRLSNQVSMFNESQYLRGTGNENGLAHTFGMDFYPKVGWNMGFTVQSAELRRDTTSGGIETVDRRAISINGGYTSNRTQWQTKLEWRHDTGAEHRTQWVTTNRFAHKFNESFRVLGRFNFSETEDKINPLADARFIEANVGFAWRPWNSTRWALLGKASYFYDVSSLAQVGDNVAYYDQRSKIFSMEGIYHADRRWEFAGKLMRREGEVRFGRREGQWADSGATFGAAQLRYGLLGKWHGLAEYRLLAIDKGGVRQGALVGIDYDLTDNMRVGVGFNFTDFSDDLTNFDYNHKGLFLNVVGRL
ncbi:hypothetical protein NT2_13_00020 [Caenibius tardaugens NBRC 16725]|uniref:Uncharacterized protein n=2 Tax=Caenibius TaxID=2827482 RepID=U2YBN4_9SPHN|nr:hypothetical protein NT2_13_00020 [Caenibius tardaugens NBRC 16725]